MGDLNRSNCNLSLCFQCSVGCCPPGVVGPADPQQQQSSLAAARITVSVQDRTMSRPYSGSRDREIPHLVQTIVFYAY